MCDELPKPPLVQFFCLLCHRLFYEHDRAEAHDCRYAPVAADAAKVFEFPPAGKDSNGSKEA